MGRKRKSGFDVCTFDVNIFSDIRMRRLIRKHHGDAVAVYTALLCLIYREGYYVAFDDDVCFYLSEQVGVSENLVRVVVEDAVSFGLFDDVAFSVSGVLTSHDIQETYAVRCAKTKRKIDIKDFSHNSEEIGINSEEIGINSEEIGINSEEIGINSEEIGINSEETFSPHAHDSVTKTLVLSDSNGDSLELFNNPSISSNNYNIQEKEKCKKEKEPVPLVSPYLSDEFVSTWELLRKQPKWKKKSQSALQMSLNKLAKYPEEYAIHLMELSIANGWQGVVFTWTPEDFRKWQSRQNGVPLNSGNKKPKDIYESNMESMNEAFRLIDEKYGT